METERIPNEITDALSHIDTTQLEKIDVVPTVPDRQLIKPRMSFQEKLNADYRIKNRDFYIEAFESLLKRLTEDNCESIAAEIISWPNSKLRICRAILQKIVSCGRYNLEKIEACALLCYHLRDLHENHHRKMWTLKEYLHTSSQMYFTPGKDAVVTNLLYVNPDVICAQLLTEAHCVAGFNANLDYLEKNRKKKKKLRDSLRVYECGMSFLELSEERSPVLEVLSRRIQALKAEISALESSLTASPPKRSKIMIVENPVSIDQDVLNSFILEEMAGYETRVSADIQAFIAKLQLCMRPQVIRAVVHLIKSVITSSRESTLCFCRAKLFFFDLVNGNVIHQTTIASILAEVLNWTTRQSQPPDISRKFFEFTAPLTHYNEFHSSRLLSEKALVRMIKRTSIETFRAWRAFNGLSEPTDQVTDDSIPENAVPAGVGASPEKISKSMKRSRCRAAKMLRQALLPVVVSHEVALKLCKKGIQNRDGVIKYLQEQKNGNNAPADDFQISPEKNPFDETGKLLLLSKSQRKRRSRKAKKKIVPMETNSDVESRHSESVFTCDSEEGVQADCLHESS